MNEQFFDCLKRERDIRIKPKLRDGNTAFRQNPTLTYSKGEVMPKIAGEFAKIALSGNSQKRLDIKNTRPNIESSSAVQRYCLSYIYLHSSPSSSILRTQNVTSSQMA